jgi:sensor histidine kinase regulating citrate/malate metabolism
MFKDKTKYIFILSFVIAILYPLVNIHLIYPSFTELLVENTEDEAVRTAMHLSSLLASDELEKDSLSVEFTNAVEQLKKDFKIEKLKVFSSSGEIIYSTNPEDIGKINKKSYFHEIVANGDTYTKLVKKDAKSLEDRVVTADVVETYVPIMVDGGTVAFSSDG